MQLVLIVCAIFMVVSGCSKAPKSYDNSPVINNKVDDRPLPTWSKVEAEMVNVNGVQKPSKLLIGQSVEGEDLLGSAEFDAKVRFNSSQPIIYDVGAGGIDYNTTYDDSKAILSKPRYEPDINGDTLYDEGLYIQWRPDEPRTPAFILVLNGYLGKIQMPAPHAPIGMGYDFSGQYTTNSVNSAQQLARDYYRIFEKADASFDCVAQSQCFVNWGPNEQKNFIVSFPGMSMLISKDRFVLFRVIIVPTIPQGIFANNVNMINGDVLVPNEKPISLGDSYADVEKRWADSVKTAKRPSTTISTNFFGRSFGGLYTAYHKTKYERTDVTPLPTDKLKAVQVWNEWTKLLTINGTPVIVSEYPDKIDVALGTPGAPLPSTGISLPGLVKTGPKQIPLQINMVINPALAKEFTLKLKDLLVEQFKLAYPTSEITSRFLGAYQQKQVKEYTVYVTAYDKTKNDGIFVQFTVSEERGVLGIFYATKIGAEFSEFDAFVMPDFQTPVEKVANQNKYTDLSGFRLGVNDLVGTYIRVTNWDLGRDEANIELLTGTFNAKKELDLAATGITERAPYYDQSIESLAFTDEKTVFTEMSNVYISSLNVSLGLTLMPMNSTDSQRTYKVTVVRSALKAGDVNGLCGGTLNASFGMSDEDFTDALDKNGNCVYYPTYDAEGNNTLQSVFFPEEGLSLSFSDFEMNAASVYAPAGEVK